MVNFTILAGGFTTFIATYVFDSGASSLQLVKNTTTGESPSWIARHPKNGSILYAVNEIYPVGNLQSFTISPEGDLTLANTISTGGSGPTFTNPLSTGEVSAMNYGSPYCSLVATDPNDPLKFIPSPVVEFPVHGGESHPHMSLEFNREVFVPDLGADKIWRLANDGAPGNFKVRGQIDIAPGNGPRHIAIHDGHIFLVTETTSRLVVLPIPEGPNGTTLPVIANVSIIPDHTFNGTFAAAEILISEPTDKFPDPLIYVSNRNLGPEFDPKGDTIAIFEFKALQNSTSSSVTSSITSSISTTESSISVAGSRVVPERRKAHARHVDRRRIDETEPTPPIDGSVMTQDALKLIAQVPTGLRQIRSMALGSVAKGAEEFLIAGANLDGGVAVFRRTEKGKNLEVVARNTDLASRTSFVFL